jgi:hypothetical protein
MQSIPAAAYLGRHKALQLAKVARLVGMLNNSIPELLAIDALDILD